ncbi:phosphodiester glycosidase family protein [Maribellus sp. YY47]|uniref:phosphodiester glycosidase family protein n=1 Tax=Maribellus sp. YY47 TaxID=2929486 RepID=UPI002001642F|nr:phosphodiester glycosidase family protein [Maribellus sp. YY47]MCK3685613.1 phosphodiester glycosidase family protein [Maribellus sp. YY47]
MQLKTSRIALLLIMGVIYMFAMASCGSETKEYNWEWENPTKNEGSADSLIIKNGWTLQTSFGNLPEYIRVYKSANVLQNKMAVAYIAVADIDKTNFKVLGNATGYHTPNDFYDAGKETVILNGGYFWDGASVSLLCKEGETLCPNSPYVWRQNGELVYYPTKGAFAEMKNGKFQVDWVYNVNGSSYAYPAPAHNSSGSAPLPQPSATFPEGGILWNAQNGIGGGPVLIKDSTVVNTYEEELFDANSGVGPTINNPRSAIAVTGTGQLIFFVCEGRNMTEGVKGLTLEDLANTLLKIGCTQALNLDGGGSSCMLINGEETIKPSDGKQRSVVTAVALN